MVATQPKAAASISSPSVTTALVPIRVTPRRVPRTEPTAIDTATGTTRTPVVRGVWPWTSWKNRVMRKMNPNSAKNATVTAPLAALNRRLANSETSMSGSVRRSSTMTKRAVERGRHGKAGEGGGRAPSA